MTDVGADGSTCISHESVLMLVLRVLIWAVAPFVGSSTLAQEASAPTPTDGPYANAVWTMAGVDISLSDHWRSTFRYGYLSDVESRIFLVELTRTLVPSLKILGGYVRLAPLAGTSQATSLARTGVTWLPLRGWLAMDSRTLIERRFSSQGGTTRGRQRLRVIWTPRARPRVAPVASAEMIGQWREGTTELRYQAGAIGTVDRLTLEGYWLQRRLRQLPARNGIGVTASVRMGPW